MPASSAAMSCFLPHPTPSPVDSAPSTALANISDRPDYSIARKAIDGCAVKKIALKKVASPKDLIQGGGYQDSTIGYRHMPNLPRAEHTRQCHLAARASRLDPDNLHPGEERVFLSGLKPLAKTKYLALRNSILRLWIRNPTIRISELEAHELAGNSVELALVKLAYDWLTRNGFINFGCVDLSDLSSVSSTTTPAPRTIVIVGAGVSGLSCARQLDTVFKQYSQKKSKTLTVGRPRIVLLEGRHRVGGRVYSHSLNSQQREDHSPGLASTVEIGAQIITGFENGNPLDTVVRAQLALRYHLLRDDMLIYDYDGTLIDKKRDNQIEEVYNDILAEASAYSWKPAVKVSSANGAPSVLTNAGEANGSGDPVLDTMPVNGFESLKPENKQKSLPSLGALMDVIVTQLVEKGELSAKDMRILNWHFANLEYANAANVGKISLGGWDQDSGNEFDGRHSQVIGGYSQMVHGLWQYPHQLDVRFGKRVTSINYDDKAETPKTGAKAAVVCEDGDTFKADAVICCMPLGLLKAHHHSMFSPSFPEWKQTAISRLGFGVLNKVILVFEKIFWEEDRDMFGYLNRPQDSSNLSQENYSEDRGRCFMFWNCCKTSGRPVLVGLLAGDAAVDAEHSTDEAIVVDATLKLATMFNLTEPPLPIESIVTRWQTDPFAGGSYSYLGPDAQEGDYDVMAKSVGNLFFAGEATCGTHPATVHGAYISGLRAAADVLDFFMGPLHSDISGME